MTSWQDEIRACEEDARSAFLWSDIHRLRELWAEEYAVNSPLERVLDKGQVLGALDSGRIRHATYDLEIERMTRHGDTVIVMGKDRVTDPFEGVFHRRYTNVWQHDGVTWRSIARHAHVVSREAASVTPSSS